MKTQKQYKLLFEILCSLFFAFIIINCFFKEKKNFENLALGIYTKSYFAKVNGTPIQSLGFKEKAEILKGVKERGLKSRVLMLGNSQSHSINQFKKGNVTFPELLADSLNSESIDVIASSIPNATYEDFYLLYKGWKKEFKIDLLFIPVFLDDTREEGVQTSFYQNIGITELNDTNRVAHIINEQLKEINRTKQNEVSDKELTYQDRTETMINKYLDTNFISWRLRSNVRGDLFNNLYKLRNTVFGIDATTKRLVIKNAYSRNMMALEALLTDCKKEKITVVLYIPPLRSDYEIPYDKSQYDQFKTEIKVLCDKYSADYRNFENLVPNQYWGVKGTRTFKGMVDIDFMHFQYPGHIIMANELQKEIKTLIK